VASWPSMTMLDQMAPAPAGSSCLLELLVPLTQRLAAIATGLLLRAKARGRLLVPTRQLSRRPWSRTRKESKKGETQLLHCFEYLNLGEHSFTDLKFAPLGLLLCASLFKKKSFNERRPPSVADEENKINIRVGGGDEPAQ
jgi:hypothetical protein